MSLWTLAKYKTLTIPTKYKTLIILKIQFPYLHAPHNVLQLAFWLMDVHELLRLCFIMFVLQWSHARWSRLNQLVKAQKMQQTNFSLINSQIEEIRMPISEKIHNCDICGKSYPRLSTLKLHKKTHRSTKEFQCLYCNQQYGAGGKRNIVSLYSS